MTKFLEKPDWIDELKEPFLPHRIADRAVRGLISNEGSAERISAAFIAEVKRRVTIIADFLGMSYLPQTETEWLKLIYYLCRHWHIPAFEEKSPKKRGAKPKWTDKKRLQLIDDVMSLVKKGMTESAACAYIAKNPRKFQNYPTNARTVHREFLRAKRSDFIPF
jgi:hypothetical protein